ncbi:hypothetical protein CIPAW_09G183500 [Carya illinoinensis]|uniref:Uncharacterized protein n=1 Tax=Carya illinoinensis TaxID=32201 RepID=A0A8T1PEP2_CARIL|nr:hypothetical protein CIPAW_09G183500 [Carya illinoinensis]
MRDQFWLLCFHSYQWVFLKLRYEITQVEQIFVVGNSGKHFEIILVKWITCLIPACLELILGNHTYTHKCTSST